MPYRLSFRFSLPTLVIALGICTGLVACGSGGGDSAGPVGSQPPPPPPANPQYAYVASVDENKIYFFKVDPSTGKLTPNGTIDTGDRPTKIAFGPFHKFAYVTNSGSHTVSMYSVDPTTGALTPLEDPGAPGVPLTIPAQGNSIDIAVDPQGRFAYTANEASASVSTFSINPITGVLTFIETVPVGGTETFSVAVDPTGSFVYATVGDINVLSDNAVHAFSIDQTDGTLTSLGLPTSAPPIAVHVAVHPNKTKPFVYVVSGIEHMVTAYKVPTSTGPLTLVGSHDTGGGASRAVVIEPSGKFAYVADLSHKVAAFKVNQSNGDLTPLPTPLYDVPNEGGIFLAVDPSGQFLYVTSDTPPVPPATTSSISVFRIDSVTGNLTFVDTTFAGIVNFGITLISLP